MGGRRLRTSAVPLVVGSLILTGGCGGTGSVPAGETPTNPPAFTDDAGFSELDAGSAECAESTKDVFVLSEENSLYAFHPPTLQFRGVGPLRCAATGATPTSMAVDRKGIAWVRYS